MTLAGKRVNETWLASLLIVGALALAIYCGLFAARHFSVETDVRDLFPGNLSWTERDKSFAAAFPQYEVLVVVDAPTPELADRASQKLLLSLRHADSIRSVQEPQRGTFFGRNGLLFLPAAQLARTAQGLKRAAPLIGGLASDPTLSGILRVFSGALEGGQNQTALASLER